MTGIRLQSTCRLAKEILLLLYEKKAPFFQTLNNIVHLCFVYMLMTAWCGWRRWWAWTRATKLTVLDDKKKQEILTAHHRTTLLPRDPLTEIKRVRFACVLTYVRFLLQPFPCQRITSISLANVFGFPGLNWPFQKKTKNKQAIVLSEKNIQKYVVNAFRRFFSRQRPPVYVGIYI